MKRFCCWLLVWCTGSFVFAQDTVVMADKALKQDNIKEAKALLDAYSQASDDFNAQWVLGQIAQFNNKKRQCIEHYERAMELAPNHYYLKLDFGRKLVKLGDLVRAYGIYNQYLRYDPLNHFVRFEFAEINFWLNRLEMAERELRKVPDSDKKASFLLDIQRARALTLGVESKRYTDDQPLELLELDAGFSKWVNRYLSVYASGDFNWVQDPETNYHIGHAGASLTFVQLGLGVDVSAGMNQLKGGQAQLNNKLSVTKSLGKAYVNLLYDNQPYYVTRASFTDAVSSVDYKASVGLSESDGWFGEASYLLQQYQGGENYSRLYTAWVLGPKISFKKHSARLGYAGNFSTSDFNTYAAANTIPQVFGGEAIRAIYDPYFTPTNQQSHSVIVQTHFVLSNRFQAGGSANIAAWGQTDNPYIYIDNDGAGGFEFVRGFATTNFRPNEIEAYLDYWFNKACMVKIRYKQLSNNFYKYQSIGLGLNYYILPKE